MSKNQHMKIISGIPFELYVNHIDHLCCLTIEIDDECRRLEIHGRDNIKRLKDFLNEHLAD